MNHVDCAIMIGIRPIPSGEATRQNNALVRKIHPPCGAHNVRLVESEAPLDQLSPQLGRGYRPHMPSESNVVNSRETTAVNRN